MSGPSGGAGAGVKLSAKWQLDAALLSRPVDLTSLVSMSKNQPELFFKGDDTIHRMIANLLNNPDPSVSDKDTKLDVLTILANLSSLPGDAAREEIRMSLQGVSEWFDQYMQEEESDGNSEPELHKSMALLLARTYEYRLKTDDILELTQGNRKLALETVVGILEDGESYSTELRQRQKPSQGQVAQWEHELVCHRFEKPLILQFCRLVRGFTHPATYFDSPEEGELALYSVDQFSTEMQALLEITMRSRLVEKLSVALYDCLFDALLEDEDELDGERVPTDDGEDALGNIYRTGLLEEADHLAISSVHSFLQNLYYYSTSTNNDAYRQHMLADTLLVPRLILPYLDRCVMHANILSRRAETYNRALSMNGGDDDGGDEVDAVAGLALEYPALVKGIAASLRTLVIASFRAPPTRFVMGLLRKLNPTANLLKASPFVQRHDYIFALLCLLNINMGALDLSRSAMQEHSVVDAYHAHSLLHDMARIYQSMDVAAQRRVLHRVAFSGALPVSRDTPSYVAVMSVLHGGAVDGQIDYVQSHADDAKAGGIAPGAAMGHADLDATGEWDARAEAKAMAEHRLESLRKESESAGDADRENMHPANENTDDSKVVSKDSREEASAADDGSIGADGKFRLLGDLPSLDGKPGAGGSDSAASGARVSLDLEIPDEREGGLRLQPRRKDRDSSSSSVPSAPAAERDPSIPEEFCCRINGHLLREPVKTPYGHVFERATIELWLSTRGSVCPITHEPLTMDQLVVDEELQNRIMRWQIQKMAAAQLAITRADDGTEDDIYDF